MNASKLCNKTRRRGSTLVIVIALLGLLVFTGMVFYTFASQERTSSEFFAEAAKAQHNEPNDVWEHLLEQVIAGPRREQLASILGSPQRRHSMVKTMFGNDNHAFSGTAIPVGYAAATDMHGTTDIPIPASSLTGALNFVDSPAAWGFASSAATPADRRSAVQAIIRNRSAGGGLPEPDVDFTYPDINNAFLAYRGYAIRETPSGGTQLVPVIIPSFMRPQYMKSPQSPTNRGALRTVDGATTYVPTDPYWAYAHEDNPTSGDPAVPRKPDAASGTIGNRERVPFVARNFRPHPLHVAGITQTGAITLRYLTDTEAADPDGNPATSDALAAGGFPFLPENDLTTTGNDPSIQGELGVWTGSEPLVIELDVDNDGDGIREGIWLDLHYPMQEVVDASGAVRKYVVLHSVTIYDLDGLLNLNVHGNIAGLPKTFTNSSGATVNHTLPTVYAQDELALLPLSRSNLGLGPNEINPIYALMRNANDFSYLTDQEDAISAFHMIEHFGGLPRTELEMANMVWLWLLMGRGNYDVDVDTSDPSNIVVTKKAFDDLFQGRFGDERLLYAALEGAAPRLEVVEMPRPGFSGDVFSAVSTGPSFGGRNGLDDNRNMLEGEPNPAAGRIRPFGHPMDFVGLGRHYSAAYPYFDTSGTAALNPNYHRFVIDPIAGSSSIDPRIPIMLHADTDGPERWRSYFGYSALTGESTTFSRYAFGVDGIRNGTNHRFMGAMDTTDDLVHNPVYDVLIEDMLETIFDPDLAKRPFDDIFVAEDLLALHTSQTDYSVLAGKGELSQRLTKLAPYVFKQDQDWTATMAPPSTGVPIAPTAFNKIPVPDHREMFTTISNTLRQIKMKQPFGGDSRPGQAGVNDDGDSFMDEPDEVLAGGYVDVDDPSRWWEFTADSNGLDADGDGFADGDGQYEFPPRFWTDDPSSGTTGVFDPGEGIQPYSALDPFRPQLRRMLTIEAGESREIPQAIPISTNHLVDVDRTGNTPLEGTPQFLTYMQRSGLRLRSLTEHPDITETGVASTTEMLKIELPADYDGDGDIDDDDDDGDPNTVKRPSEVQFPPNTVQQREFWARRDRQQMARDIYVLLYTLGGVKQSSATTPSIVDYTAENNPNLPLGDDTSTAALYTHDQLRRMAQFAVNMVDSMDTDNVVTKFEYDKNLGNGWNLDDDPYTEDFAPAVDQRTLATSDAGYDEALGLTAYQNVTGDGLYPEDSGYIDANDDDGDGDTTEMLGYERGVVYGVEAQQLALSEVLGIRSPQLSMDHPATPYDDSTAERDFVFVELQNVLPQTLDLAPSVSTSAANAVWRIARFDRAVNGNTPSTSGIYGANPTTVRAASDPTRAIAITDHAENEVDGGGRFSISATGAADLGSSGFYVDVGNSTTGMFNARFDLMAPEAPAAIAPTTSNSPGNPDYPPLTDLDVIHTDHTGRFELFRGPFLEDLPALYEGNAAFETRFNNNHYQANGQPGFDLVLQRRLNPNMPMLPEDENPWVEMDRTRVLIQDFNLADGDGAIQVFNDTTTPPTGHVTLLESLERSEPLNDQLRFPSVAKSTSEYRLNTLKGSELAAKPDDLGVNAASLPDPTQPVSSTNAADPFEIWQPHFDRDFASTVELLHLPLVGPNGLTQQLARMRFPGDRQIYDDPAGAAGLDPLNAASAEAMVLVPDFPDTSLTPPEETARDNEWYRLFEFIEVPSRVHRMLGNYLAQRRVPGKINLNTVRHLEVYAGLIDDPMFAHPNLPGAAPRAPQFLRDQTPGALRDRWQEYLQQRDGNTVASLQDPDPSTTGNGVAYQIVLPGTPGASPFRAPGHRDASTTHGVGETVLQTLKDDRDTGASNRNWLEVGSAAFHNDPTSVSNTSTAVQRHQILSKIMNNTTTVSNSFVVYATAAYFEAYEDPATGFVRVGGRIDLDNPGDNGDLTEDAGEDHTTGWQQRAIFVIDRTEAINAFDQGSGSFDWRRLIKERAIIE